MCVHLSDCTYTYSFQLYLQINSLMDRCIMIHVGLRKPWRGCSAVVRIGAACARAVIQDPDCWQSAILRRLFDFGSPYALPAHGRFAPATENHEKLYDQKLLFATCTCDRCMLRGRHTSLRARSLYMGLLRALYNPRLSPKHRTS